MKKRKAVVLIDSRKNKLQSRLGVAKGQVWGGFLHPQTRHATQNSNPSHYLTSFFNPQTRPHEPHSAMPSSGPNIKAPKPWSNLKKLIIINNFMLNQSHTLSATHRYTANTYTPTTSFGQLQISIIRNIWTMTNI